MVPDYRHLEEARTANQVVALTRDYLSTVSARDLARLPAPCRPKHIADETDIAACARHLTREYWRWRGTAAEVGVLPEIWSFFLRATVQIDRLREREQAGE
jgi:hypothetical protein